MKLQRNVYNIQAILKRITKKAIFLEVESLPVPGSDLESIVVMQKCNE